MKKAIAIAAVLALVCSACAQNNVLAQLGARGVTTTGGTSAYRSYLVRLDANGKFSLAVMPQALVAVPFAQLVYVDGVAGADAATATGGVTLPYKTLAYAASAFIRRNLEPVVYLLNPGNYGSTSLDPLALPGITDFAVCGYGADSTVITELEFESAGVGDNVTVTLSGVRVQLLAQRNAKTLTLRLRNGARVDTLAMDYPSTCTVIRDPESTVGAFLGTSYTETLSATASSIAFFYGGSGYTNVNNALNYLIDRDLSEIRVTSRQTNDWSTGVNSWTNSAAYGITAADTNKWSTLALDGANNIMWTVTALEWSNSVAKAITSVDTQHWNAAWGIVSSYNSHSVNTTMHTSSGEKADWNNVKSQWDASAAKLITGSDTNRWDRPKRLWAADGPGQVTTWADLEVVGGSVYIVTYQTEPVFTPASFAWFLDAPCTVRAATPAPYPVFGAAIDTALPGLPQHILAPGNDVTIPGVIGELRVGGGVFGGITGIGFEVDGLGLVIEYSEIGPPAASEWLINTGTAVSYGDYFDGSVRIYRVDYAPEFSYMRTNEIGRVHMSLGAGAAPLATTQQLAAAVAPKLDRTSGTATNLTVVGSFTLNGEPIGQCPVWQSCGPMPFAGGTQYPTLSQLGVDMAYYATNLWFVFPHPAPRAHIVIQLQAYGTTTAASTNPVSVAVTSGAGYGAMTSPGATQTSICNPPTLWGLRSTNLVYIAPAPEYTTRGGAFLRWDLFRPNTLTSGNGVTFLSPFWRCATSNEILTKTFAQ